MFLYQVHINIEMNIFGMLGYMEVTPCHSPTVATVH